MSSLDKSSLPIDIPNNEVWVGSNTIFSRAMNNASDILTSEDIKFWMEQELSVRQKNRIDRCIACTGISYWNGSLVNTVLKKLYSSFTFGYYAVSKDKRFYGDDLKTVLANVLGVVPRKVSSTLQSFLTTVQGQAITYPILGNWLSEQCIHSRHIDQIYQRTGYTLILCVRINKEVCFDCNCRVGNPMDDNRFKCIIPDSLEKQISNLLTPYEKYASNEVCETKPMVVKEKDNEQDELVDQVYKGYKNGNAYVRTAFLMFLEKQFELEEDWAVKSLINRTKDKQTLINLLKTLNELEDSNGF